MNKKILVSSVVMFAFILFGFVFGYFYSIYSSSNITPSYEAGVPMLHVGNLCAQVIRADGTKEPVVCNHNQFPNSGRNMTRDYLNTGTGLLNITVIAAGNVTTSQTVTENWLNGEYANCGFIKAAGTITALGSGNWSIAKTFTSTCADVVVNGTALMNGTNVGNYTFAMGNFTSATLQSADQLTVTWFVWVL